MRRYVLMMLTGNKKLMKLIYAEGNLKAVCEVFVIMSF
jgi:hypothetical protein